MKKALPIILSLILILAGCKEKQTTEISETYPNGNKKKVAYYQVNGDKKTKVKEVLYYESGKKQMEGTFTGDKKNGEWISWFENGKIQSEGSFKNDLRNGKAVVWRENGFKYYEGTYSMGKLHGTWISYDTDGSRLTETLFEYGKKVKEINYKENIPKK